MINTVYRHKSDERPDRLARIMIELEVEAAWSTCQRLGVASALVTTDGQILVMARNGTPRGQQHCKSLASPDERCIFCIHAERNVINRAARMGIPTRGQHLFTLVRPCVGCANDIVEADIVGVYYRQPYLSDGKFEYVANMLEDRRIAFYQLEMSEQEKTFSAVLAEWRKTWTV